MYVYIYTYTYMYIYIYIGTLIVYKLDNDGKTGSKREFL